MIHRLAIVLTLSTLSPITAQGQAPVLEAKGYIVPVHRSQLSARVPGEVIEINIKEGSLVRRGDLILRIDPTPYQIDLQRVEAGLQAAEARVRQILDAGEGTSNFDKVNAKAMLTRAQADRDMARYRLDATSMRSPIDGTVLFLSAQIGDSLRGEASNARPVAIIADLTRLEVEVEIPERHISRVQAGQKCEIQPDAYPDLKLIGRLTRIVPVAQRDRNIIPVRIEFEAPRNPQLLPDMSAVVRFLDK